MVNNVWFTPSRGDFTFDTMIEAIKEYILSDSNYQYYVFVGTDAQAHPKNNAVKYVTAVVVQKVGKGGQYYYNKQYNRLTRYLKEKIWNEATINYEVIERIKDSLDGIIDKKFIIPHLDLGNIGPTSDLINQITGFYIASGYDNIQTKPNSWASSGVADKHSK